MNFCMRNFKKEKKPLICENCEKTEFSYHDDMIVCKNCGIVLENLYIDVTSDDFSYDDFKANKRRCNISYDKRFPTITSRTGGYGFASINVPSIEQQSFKDMKNIHTICLSLSISKIYENKIFDLFEYIKKDLKIKDRDRNRQGYIAACLSKIIHDNNINKSDRDICNTLNISEQIFHLKKRDLKIILNHQEIEYKDIQDEEINIKKYINEALNTIKNSKYFHSILIIKNYIRKLPRSGFELRCQEEKLTKLFEKIKEKIFFYSDKMKKSYIYQKHNLSSIAIVLIYIVFNNINIPLSKKTLSDIFSISENTIIKCYRNLCELLKIDLFKEKYDKEIIEEIEKSFEKEKKRVFVKKTRRKIRPIIEN